MSTPTEADTDRTTVGALLTNLSLSPRHYVALLVVLGLASAPLWLGTLTLLQMMSAFYFIMFVISWDFVSGYTDQVSFGHTFFFAIGGYTSVILNLELGLPPLVGIVVAIVLTSIAGVLYAIPALRIGGHYLALFTLMPPLILGQLFIMFSDIFGGTRGLPTPDPLLQVGDFATTALANYFLALGILLLIFAISFVITRSDTGKIFKAIREDKYVVSASGLNPAKFKIFAMVVSAALAGFAGAMFAHSPVGSATPGQLLELTIIIDILLASILGGVGTIVGPAVGGFIFWWARQLSDNIEWIVPGLDVPFTRINLIVFYVLTLLIMLFIPRGIFPVLLDFGRSIWARITGESSDSSLDG
ncbi:branched-chain amino acid ABC transporter permease [Haladaptatus sp. ZSTT2]|uniref:branched-chain amino acid ABC transporter permease n=1 Tax=Haladaptatus sp. ZSTT2 TaxID=3120515 RepID=UPI00300E9F28